MASGSVVNLDQQKFWNEVKGEFWVNLKERIDSLLFPFGEAALEELAVKPGERVLEIGCGTGASSMRLSNLVGRGGEVLAVDLSKPMLEKAKNTGKSLGINNVSFLEVDAEVFSLPQSQYDAVFSRFGVMFFEDPIKAFRNFNVALKPGGRLSYVCWAAREDNPWIRVPTAAAREFLDIPPAPPQDSPGQFAMEREERIKQVLDESGWLNMHVKKFELEHLMGTNAHDAATFICQMGPMSEPFSLASSRIREDCIAAVEGALESFEVEDGVRMKFSTWLVTAYK